MGEQLNEFPFTSRYIDVYGSKIHYIDEGKGDPILFIHGIPTSSYLWRNIIPTLVPHARCIALDLIGLGKSEKPGINYRVFDYINYLEEFINVLGLKNITLVMHAWGSAIGFDYARRHEKNVKGLSFLEAHLKKPTSVKDLSLPVQQFTAMIHDVGHEAIINTDFYINKVLTSGTIRKLSDTELAMYKEPFQTPKSREVLWQYLHDLPFVMDDDGPKDVLELLESNSTWLQNAELPKLMFYNIPGFVTSIETVMWAKKYIPNLTLVEIDGALHYVQKYQAGALAASLKDWYSHLEMPILEA